MEFGPAVLLAAGPGPKEIRLFTALQRGSHNKEHKFRNEGAFIPQEESRFLRESLCKTKGPESWSPFGVGGVPYLRAPTVLSSPIHAYNRLVRRGLVRHGYAHLAIVAALITSGALDLELLACGCAGHSPSSEDRVGDELEFGLQANGWTP